MESGNGANTGGQQTMKNKTVYVYTAVLTILLAATYVYGTALDDYVNKPDPAYRYEILRTIDSPDGTGYIVDMVSQEWRTSDEVNRTRWRHWLHIAVPNELKHSKAMLIIEGGANGGPAPERIDGTVASMARRTKSIVGCLQMVPNEPLRFAGEDFDGWVDDYRTAISAHPVTIDLSIVA
jgi:PhoPQ-activated pathogenicity-related protein